MKNQKGITLIALVITIIVLLILAGVAIAMLSGENGILTRARDARDNSDKGNLEEATKIAVGELFVGDETTDANTLGQVPDWGTDGVNLKNKIEAVNDNLGTVTLTGVKSKDATGEGNDYYKVSATGTAQVTFVEISSGRVTSTDPTK